MKHDRTWEAEAACKGIDPDILFPEGSTAGWDANHAKKLCATCPVAAVVGCARTALEVNEDYVVTGVWAGEYLGYATRTRQKALEALRAIAGATTPKPVRKGGRQLRSPAECTGICGRMVRPVGRTLEEFPDTLSAKRKGMCVSCFRKYLAGELHESVAS
ncbi:WhiB family transcriptional regulator [Rhodococcus sp. NPDC057297]|uniref:WhiB family transcriptional regulator n=1 Tax=Rhodococcus sp. NPDC057297 TaxID=3346090 RepID=UPI00362B856E